MDQLKSGQDRTNTVINGKCPSCMKDYRLTITGTAAYPVLSQCNQCRYTIQIDKPPPELPPHISKSAETIPENGADFYETIAIPPVPDSVSGDSESNPVQLFIGNNAYLYLDKFKHFTVSGQPRYTPTWHWQAFLFSPYWFMYRKLYVWAFVSFLIGLIPGINLISKIIWGITGNYLYYKHVSRKIDRLRIRYSSDRANDLPLMLQKKGGVHRWVWGLAAVPVAGILAAIAIPQFDAYRTRSFDSQARVAVENVMSAQQAYFGDNGQYADSVKLLQPLLGEFIITSPLRVLIHNADTNNYSVEGFHPRGHHRFTATAAETSATRLPMKSRDLFGPYNWCKITIPDDWQAMKNLNADADIQAGNPDKDVYAIVLVEDKTDFFGVDLESFSELSKTGIEDYLLSVNTTPMDMNRVGGRKAIQHKITGSLPDTRVSVVYLHTVVQGHRAFYQILTWTSAEHYDENNEMLNHIVQWFVEI